MPIQIDIHGLVHLDANNLVLEDNLDNPDNKPWVMVRITARIMDDDLICHPTFRTRITIDGYRHVQMHFIVNGDEISALRYNYMYSCKQISLSRNGWLVLS